MTTPVITKTYAPPPVDTAEILRYSGCPSPNEGELSLMEECLEELEASLSYRVCYATLPISEVSGALDLGFAKTDSASLARRLQGCGSCIVFAATLGLSPDRLIMKYGRLSPARALFIDAIGTERIESFCNAFCGDIKSELEGRHLTARFSPGYGDLPLELQRDIFALLDCPRKIGLTLSESLFMSPSKSVTAIAGISDTPVFCESDTCGDCNKENCAFARRAR